ncbi:3669_t:CDS:2 [Ambispora leptoticha]|uniref:3669_t:CDS:1 n=1 Tax=Ambispora leptoticha TaxID=144679 RepID=A0A9N8ZDP5_9GLOM|nr:3669_t:CDS:2 [Ambispora leptoticha]
MALDRAKKVVNEKHERILLEMAKQPGNDVCADCGAKAPRWASHSIGIFLCIRCGSIHRKMGTHISKVKSISLDSWTPDQVENMKQWGNLKANAKWNPRPELNPVPVNASDSEMERYIRNKYERKAFMDPKPPQSKNRANGSRSSASSVSSSVISPVKRAEPIVTYSDKGDTTTSNKSGFESALRQLHDMGFTDTARNREILSTTNGDLNAAIEILCKLPPSSGSGGTGGNSGNSVSAKPLSQVRRTSSMSDEEKVTALWNLGFHDEAKNRDALRRTGGNVEVAAAILNDERSKPPETGSPATVSNTIQGPKSTSSNSSLNGTAQLDSQRRQHKLPLTSNNQQSRNSLLIDTPATPPQPQQQLPNSSLNPLLSQQTSNLASFGQNNPFGFNGLSQGLGMGVMTPTSTSNINNIHNSIGLQNNPQLGLVGGGGGSTNIQQQNSLSFANNNSIMGSGSGSTTPFSELIPSFGNLNLGNSSRLTSSTQSFGAPTQKSAPVGVNSAGFLMSHQQTPSSLLSSNSSASLANNLHGSTNAGMLGTNANHGWNGMNNFGAF